MSIRTKAYRDRIEDRHSAALDFAVGIWAGSMYPPGNIADIFDTAQQCDEFLRTGRSPFKRRSANIININLKGKPA